MKKQLKTILVGLICLCMVALFVPTQAFATTPTVVTTLAELKAALAGTDVVVKLGDDIEITESIKTTTNVTVDLNGYTITGPDDGTANWYAFIVEDGVFTLKDSSEAQTGEIYAKCYGVETKGGTFIMESGKITATKNAGIGAAIVNYGGKVEVRGGTLLASNWALNAQAYFANMEIVITGGSFETTSDDKSAVQIGGEYTQKEETVDVSGGIFIGTSSFNVNSEATVSITGGTFDTDVSEYLAENAKIEKNAENKYVVFKSHDIAISNLDGGKVTVSKEKAFVKDSIEIEVEAEEGYILKSVTVLDADENSVAITNNKFTMPDSDVTVSVEFEKLEYTVAIEASENVTVTPNKDVTVKYGENVELAIVADEGYKITSVKVDDVEQELVDGKLTLANVKANVKVAVVAEQIIYDVTDGAKQEVAISEDTEEVSFKINCEFSLFDGKVYLDDKLVDEDLYIAKEGSTIITFKADYVKTWTEGNHTLKVAFADGGSATTEFTVKAVETDDVDKTDKEEGTVGEGSSEAEDEEASKVEEEETDNPKTGDYIMLFVALFVVATLGLVFTKKVNKTKHISKH